MAFLVRNNDGINKDIIIMDEFDKLHFEPIENNDYYSYWIVSVVKKDITNSVINGSQVNTQSKLASLSLDKLSKLFGEPNFIKYKEYDYDIWVLLYDGVRMVIRCSDTITKYSIEYNVNNVNNFHSDTESGKYIEKFLLKLLERFNDK